MTPACVSTLTLLAPLFLSAFLRSSAALAALFEASHPHGTISPALTARAFTASVLTHPGSSFVQAAGPEEEEEEEEEEAALLLEEEDDDEDEDDLPAGGVGLGGGGGGAMPKKLPMASFCALFAASK